MVSTANDLPGFDVAKTLGLVRGISVQARGFGPMLCAVCQAIWWGGRIAVVEHLCETARRGAHDAMLERARAMGANAVVGVRYDSSTLGPISEFLCYGTAVVAEPTAGVRK
jgi:uncharacterized protein YbjQ (UPF0145 family)